MASRDIRRAKQRKGESISDNLEKRRTTHPMMYVGLIVLLVVIVVTFVLAGPGGPLTRSGGGNVSGSVVFGTYEGRDIAYYAGSYYAQQTESLANQVRNSGSTQDPEATKQAVWYQSFLNTAEHIAILTQAEKAGVTVTEDAIDKALISYPAYLDENGKFSEALYTAATPADKAAARKLMRETLLSNTFVNDIMSGVKDGSKEAAFVTAMARPERAFTFVSWPFASFPPEEVRKYGEANKSRFVKIKLSRILVKTGESQANEIRKKIVGKTSTFEELAKTYSKDAYADKGGDMGWRYAYDLEADFDAKETAQKVLGLKAGELSDVVKGTFGWMIYRCDAEALEADFANATVQDDVRSYITRYEKGKIEDYFNGKAAEISRRAGEVGFDLTVKETGVKPLHTEYFPINLGNIFSFAPVKAKTEADTPSTAASNEDFFFRAFSLGKGQVSAPIVLDDQVLVLRLDGEQQLPDTTASLLGNWISYIASQSIQSDLAEALMTPDKLKDNFAVVYNQIFPPSGIKQ